MAFLNALHGVYTPFPTTTVTRETYAAFSTFPILTTSHVRVVLSLGSPVSPSVARTWPRGGPDG